MTLNYFLGGWSSHAVSATLMYAVHIGGDQVGTSSSDAEFRFGLLL